jgi:regulatory protein
LRLVALRLLGRRDYSSHELEERLLARGFPATDIAAHLEVIRQHGLIDDRRVAEAHVRTASRVKGRGRSRIRRELLARGIPDDLADSAVRALTADDEDQAIRRLLARHGTGVLASPENQRRLFNRLLRRGFSPTAISRALRSSQQDDE